MGTLEKKSKHRLHRTQLNVALLSTIQAAGFVTVALLAPNALQALKKAKLFPEDRRRVKTALDKLVDKGYVRLERRSGSLEAHLTEKGESFADLVMAGEAKPVRPKKWDGRWRVVTYDLKKPTESLRRRLRELLRSFGFTLLQRSIWVYPYDCEDLIAILKRELRLGGSLLYIIADQIENDGDLRKHFGLPPSVK